jgi:hypothetical protein
MGDSFAEPLLIATLGAADHDGADVREVGIDGSVDARRSQCCVMREERRPSAGKPPEDVLRTTTALPRLKEVSANDVISRQCKTYRCCTT